MAVCTMEQYVSKAYTCMNEQLGIRERIDRTACDVCSWSE